MRAAAVLAARAPGAVRDALRRVSDRMRLLLPLGRAACCCGCGRACLLCLLLPWRGSGLPLLLRCRPGLLLAA